MITHSEPDIFKVSLKRKQGQYLAHLGFTSLPVYSLLLVKDQYLQESEIAYYKSLLHDRMRKSFLQGRYIAKKVVSSYLNESDLKSIRIKSGVFNQPLVEYAKTTPPMISIAHTDSYAVCLAFSEEHPMGIDLEPVHAMAKENISSQITAYEKGLYHTVDEEENAFYTRLWSVKEALSKTIKTGIMTPFDVFQIDAIDEFDGYTVSTFTNFAQYKAISFTWNKNICSIVLPRETECDIPVINSYKVNKAI